MPRGRSRRRQADDRVLCASSDRLGGPAAAVAAHAPRTHVTRGYRGATLCPACPTCRGQVVVPGHLRPAPTARQVARVGSAARVSWLVVLWCAVRGQVRCVIPSPIPVARGSVPSGRWRERGGTLSHRCQRCHALAASAWRWGSRRFAAASQPVARTRAHGACGARSSPAQPCLPHAPSRLQWARGRALARSRARGGSVRRRKRYIRRARALRLVPVCSARPVERPVDPGADLGDGGDGADSGQHARRPCHGVPCAIPRLGVGAIAQRAA